jgi:hypothetical protein
MLGPMELEPNGSEGPKSEDGSDGAECVVLQRLNSEDSRRRYIRLQVAQTSLSGP